MATDNSKPGRGGQPGTRSPPGRLARRHPFISAAALTGVGLVIFVLLWFQPRKTVPQQDRQRAGTGGTGLLGAHTIARLLAGAHRVSRCGRRLAAARPSPRDLRIAGCRYAAGGRSRGAGTGMTGGA